MIDDPEASPHFSRWTDAPFAPSLPSCPETTRQPVRDTFDKKEFKSCTGGCPLIPFPDLTPTSNAVSIVAIVQLISPSLR